MNKLESELHFSREEYHQRIVKTRKAMDKKGIDLLIVHDPSNMSWLTGYDGWSFYVPQCVLLPVSGDPLWFGREQDVNGAKKTVFMDYDNILGYPDTYVQNPPAHAMQYLASEVLPQLGFTACNIGVEMDNYYYSARSHQCLADALPNSKLIDATGLVNWQRAVKSPAEIDYMRIAGKIVEKIHQRILEVARPGLNKNKLVAEIFYSGIAGHPDYGGDYTAIVPLLPSGEDASAPHITWNDMPLRNNEGTFFEVGGCYRRYHCPLSRTIYFGTPPKQISNAHEVILDAMAAGLDYARAGNTCDDIARAFFTVLEKNGINKSNRAGYSIGLSYPPDWGERTMSLRRDDHTELRAGMTFHFMSGLWMDNWGLETTESILITSNDVETLANYPRELFIL